MTKKEALIQRERMKVLQEQSDKEWEKEKEMSIGRTLFCMFGLVLILLYLLTSGGGW